MEGQFLDQRRGMIVRGGRVVAVDIARDAEDAAEGKRIGPRSIVQPSDSPGAHASALRAEESAGDTPASRARREMDAFRAQRERDRQTPTHEQVIEDLIRKTGRGTLSDDMND